MRAVILHGTGADHDSNWFPWLKGELKKLGHEVWVPDLPNPSKPSIKENNEFLLNSGWDFSNNLIIGHSSGSVAILGLLQALPEGTGINTAILVGTFSGDLGREDLNGLNETIDYELVKDRAKQFIVIQEENDPRVSLEGGKWVAEQLGAELVVLPGKTHFTVKLDPKYSEFPELLKIIKSKVE